MKNNRNRKELVVMAVLTIVISAGVTTAFAHRAMGPNIDPAQRDAIQEAIANGDYQAWSDLTTGQGRMAEVINQDNFSQLAALEQARQAGDFEAARVIEEELGLPERMGQREGLGQGQKMFRDDVQHQVIEEAINNNDYQAWLDLQPEGSRMTELINQDNFSKLVAIHQAMEDNDWQTAKQLKEELGLYKLGNNKGNFGRGMHKNFEAK